MFEQTFVEPPPDGKKSVSLAASVAAQLFVLILLIGIPLIYTQGLPGRVLRSFLVAPPVPHASVAQTPQPEQITRPQTRILDIRQLLTRPVFARRTAPDIPAAPDIEVGLTGVPAAAGDIVASGVIGSVAESAAPLNLTPAPSAEVRHGPVHVGSIVEAANLIHKVMPVYPEVAKAARLQGVVEFTALISKDGTIENLKLVHGHPLFVEAARQAVMRWRYRPTMLNGAPVEVITGIVVNFTLSQ